MATAFPLILQRARSCTSTRRTFFPEDNRAGAEPVAVLSNGLWKRRFGSDRHIIGKLAK